MFRFFLILSLCLWLVGCDKQSESPDRTKVAGSSKSSSRRGLTATGERLNASANSTQDLLAEAETLGAAEREQALAAIAWESMETDPETAHRAYAKLTRGSPEKMRLIGHYAMLLAEDYPEQAVEWALALENETEISSALTHIAVVLAESDPARAASLLAEHGQPSHDLNIAVVQVVQRWAARSVTEAADWVSRLPFGDARQAGARVIAEHWLPQDAPAAFAWMNSLKNTGLRQETARAMEGLILQQPESTRAAWRQHANETVLKELEQQRENALKDVSDNIPPAVPEDVN